MRGMRWLLLVAIAAILGGVVYQYRAQKKLLAGNMPVAPAPLSADLSASSQHWQYRDKDLKTGRIKSDIDAESMQQVKDASRVDLKNVTMKVYGKDGKTYDLVKSAAATFNTAEKSLYSEGDVEITLNLPVEGSAGQTADRHQDFRPDLRQQHRTRRYRPALQLRLRKGRRQGHRRHLRSGQPRTADEARRRGPLESAGEERQAHEDRSRHARLSRDHQRDLAQAVGPHDARKHDRGRQRRRGQTAGQGDPQHHRGPRPRQRRLPNRKLRYAADELAMDFDDDGLAQKINGNRNASLVSTTDASETTVTADRVDLDLQPRWPRDPC